MLKIHIIFLKISFLYHFENFFSSCSIGMVQNGNSSTIYYDFSFFRNNHDIAKAVCKEIIKLYL